jgi:hypothetical protein
MEKGQVLEYTGKGFLGFDKDDTGMMFIEKESFNTVYVMYRGNRIVVYPHEIKEVK